MGSKEHETKNSGPRSLSVTKCGVQCLHFPSVQQWSSVLFLRGDARDSGLLPAGDRAHFRAAFLQRAYPQLPLTSQVTPGGRGQPSRNTGRGVLLRIWEALQPLACVQMQPPLPFTSCVPTALNLLLKSLLPKAKNGKIFLTPSQPGLERSDGTNFVKHL